MRGGQAGVAAKTNASCPGACPRRPGFDDPAPNAEGADPESTRARAFVRSAASAAADYFFTVTVRDVIVT